MRVCIVNRRDTRIVDYIEARARSGKQSQAEVKAYLVRPAVVLNERLKIALRRQRPVEAPTHQIGVEVTFRQANPVANIASGEREVVANPVASPYCEPFCQRESR